MKLIIAVVRPFKVAEIVDAIGADSYFPGMTVIDVRGFGREKTAPHPRRAEEELKDFVERSAIVVAAPAETAAAIAERIARRIATGEEGDAALQ